MKIFNFLKKNIFNIFFVSLLIIFFITGRFNILIDRTKSFFGQDKGEYSINVEISDIKTGENFKLSDLKGKVILVNFWATWCPPCKYEIPSFIDLKNKYGSDGFELIGISVDQANKTSILSFMQEYKINYPVVMQNKSTLNTFGEIVAVPTSFLINQEGKIEKKYSGIYPKISFETVIRRLLNKS